MIVWLKRNSPVIVFAVLATILGMNIQRIFGQPSRSAVYEIPMADKGQSWRVTSFQGKLYVLIEAPSMPENYLKGKPRE